MARKYKALEKFKRAGKANFKVDDEGTVFIKGNTKRSREWQETIELNPSLADKINVSSDGRSYTMSAYLSDEKRKALAQLVDEIVGLDDKPVRGEDVEALFLDTEIELVELWDVHLNFLQHKPIEQEEKQPKK